MVINTIKRTSTISPQNNKIKEEDYPIHDWYRFILSFPPHLVRKYITKFNINSNMTILDPFCGTGTVLVESKKNGINSIGIEANPIAAYASVVKTNWTVDPEKLLNHANEIAEKSLITLKEKGIDDENPDREVKILFPDIIINKLPEEKEKLLLRNSISSLPLHKTLILIENIEKYKDIRFYDYERLALAKALVFYISNLRFGPEIGIGKCKVDTSVIKSWLDCVRKMSTDLCNLDIHSEGGATIYKEDSRFLANIIKHKSIDAVITSPPYPNEKDYTRITRLELVLLGFINNKNELRLLKDKFIRSNTRGIYKNDNDDMIIANFKEITRIADEIEKRRIQLGKNSGFEKLYARLTKLYFGGMHRHLDCLRPFLSPGAKLAYVVGDQASYLQVMIRTGHLLAEIASSLGYKVIDIETFRERFATATKQYLREEVLILEWEGYNR